jgi:hypothetical protein
MTHPKHELAGSRVIAQARCARILLQWLGILSLFCLVALPVAADDQPAATAPPTKAPSKFISPEDGWLDISEFMNQRFGFMPIVLPITEPAVGYGTLAGPAFVGRPSGSDRPNITVVAGMATGNDTWGVVAGNSRTWRNGRIQTLAGGVYASINLDYYGIGENSVLAQHPLRYTLEPKGGLVQIKNRLGRSHLWVGLGYGFISTNISFEAPEGTPDLPDYNRTTNIGRVDPSLTFDSRNNIFTPTRGTYVQATAGLSGKALGGDYEFQRLQLIVMQFAPLPHRFFFGVRGHGAAVFGDAPFFIEPFVLMRGVPAMRYAGEGMAQIEAELRWQFWNRISLVGFVGTGTAWNELGRSEKEQTVTAGGAGLRYELARKYGLHTGADIAFGPNDATLYVTIGSAWLRP